MPVNEIRLNAFLLLQIPLHFKQSGHIQRYHNKCKSKPRSKCFRFFFGQSCVFGSLVTFLQRPQMAALLHNTMEIKRFTGRDRFSDLYITPVNGDIVTCTLTSNIACPQANPVTSNPVTMTVNSNSPVSLTIAASNNPVCSGIPVTYSATPTNGGSLPAFQWKVNGSPAGTNSPNYTYTPLSGDVVTCTLTSNIACPQANPVTSNTITMVISDGPLVSFSGCFDTITSINAKPIKLKGGYH